MKVKAREGLRVPYEHKANQYIGSQIVEVEETAYYLRQIKVGDLVEVTETKPIKKMKKEESTDGK